MKITEQEYRALDALNCSGIKNILKSPAHYMEEKTNPKDQAVFALGRAVHCIILEPEKFGATYRVAPKIDKRTKEGKAEWAAFQAANAGSEIISDDDMGICLGIRNSIAKNPYLAEIFSEGQPEETHLWEQDGIKLKSRLDWICDHGIIDIKTTQCADDYDFARSVYNFKYHLQAFMYREAHLRNTGKCLPFIFVAIEKTPPYGHRVYLLDDSWFVLGAQEFQKGLNIYKQCLVDGFDRIYDTSVTVLSMMNWVKNNETK